MTLSEKLHAELFGDPKNHPLVLINGFGRCQAHWCGFAEALSESFYVLAVDNPGVGLSNGVNRYLSIQQMADLMVSQFLGHQGYHIVGLSMGGMIARAIVRRLEGRAASLTLINTIAATPRQKRVYWKSVIRMSIADLFTPQDKRVIAEISLGDHQGEAEAVMQKWLEIEKKYPLRLMAAIRQFIALMLHREPWDFEGFPASLLIKASNDLLVPSSNMDTLADFIPNSTLMEVEGTHEVTSVKPGHVATIIRDFVMNSQAKATNET